ncbi:hypothetical protein Droror1_Dr00011946 [Drosera rotundifolia]
MSNWFQRIPVSAVVCYPMYKYLCSTRITRIQSLHYSIRSSLFLLQLGRNERMFQMIRRTVPLNQKGCLLWKDLFKQKWEEEKSDGEKEYYKKKAEKLIEVERSLK